jgi:hypothetical protein
MKVFLSWSGALSHRVAVAFSDWLPSVIQSVDPYVSSEDIEKGAPWSPELDKALTESRFGIICLTADNQDSRWLNFEAGVLARAIENPKMRVSPFLFNPKQSDVQGPLTRFQSTRNEKDEVRKLLSAVNNAAPEERDRLKQEILERSFKTYWPDLEAAFGKIAKDYKPGEATKPVRPESEILDEILELTRAQQRQVVSREDLAQILRSIEDRLPFTAWAPQPLGVGAWRPTLDSGSAISIQTGYGFNVAKPYLGGQVEITEALGPMTVTEKESAKEKKE